MKFTLLEICQEIASSMDSDDFTSINDNTESEQIAKVVRRAYFDLITRQKMPEHYTLFNLTESSDATKPTVMTVPEDYESVDDVRYNVETTADTDMDYRQVHFLPLKEFLDQMYRIQESETNVGTFNLDLNSNFTNFLYYNNKAPTFYTCVNDNTLIFDSYDISVDTVCLQSSKTLAFGRKSITWEMSDAYVPEIDESQFPLLINEAKSLAWLELKQMPHQKAEQNARRQLLRSQTTKTRVKGLSDFEKLPSFGRK